MLDDPFGPSPRVRNVLEGSTVENGRLQGRPLEGGSLLQPALSYDGKTVLFAYTECGLSAGRASAEGRPSDPTWGVEMKERPPWAPKTSYHIFRVNVGGTGLIQLTDGPWNDLHPNWLPDGRIVFISERRGGFGRCHGRPVPLFTLHAMDADGRNMARLASPKSEKEVANWRRVCTWAASNGFRFPYRGAQAMVTTETAHRGSQIRPSARRGGGARCCNAHYNGPGSS